MSHFPIAALTWLFGFVTLAALLGVAYRFRRLPVVALIAVGERRADFHRDALAALDSAIASARAEGRTAEADRLVPSRAAHVRALDGLATAKPFARTR